MPNPTAAQMNCGYAQHGYPALCTCGTCEWVDEGCGCIWCDLGFTPRVDGQHYTTKGVYSCTKKPD